MKATKILPALLFVAAASAAGAQTNVPGANFLATWDTNGDGTVTLDEATALRTEIFKTYDLNGDGVLSEEEREAMDGDRLRLRDQDRDMTQDQTQSGGGGNGNGAGNGNGNGGQGGATTRTMTRAQQALALGDDGFLAKALDTNGDGLISLDEFVAGTADWLARLDKTGDGVITTDDFGK